MSLEWLAQQGQPSVQDVANLRQSGVLWDVSGQNALIDFSCRQATKSICHHLQCKEQALAFASLLKRKTDFLFRFSCEVITFRGLHNKADVQWRVKYFFKPRICQIDLLLSYLAARNCRNICWLIDIEPSAVHPVLAGLYHYDNAGASRLARSLHLRLLMSHNFCAAWSTPCPNNGEEMPLTVRQAPSF